MSKGKKNPSVTVRRSELNRLLKKHTATANDFALAIVYSALRDEFNFGPKRLLRLHEYVNKLSCEISEGRISLLDLRDTLSSECGILFVRGDIEEYIKEQRKFGAVICD